MATAAARRATEVGDGDGVEQLPGVGGRGAAAWDGGGGGRIRILGCQS